MTDAAHLVERFPHERGISVVDRLVADTDYDFEERCRAAATYWTHRLAAAQALLELVAEGSLFEEGSRRTERVSQDFGPPRGQGGTSGSYVLDELDLSYPSRVRLGLFASSRLSAGKPIDYAFAALRAAIGGASLEVVEAADYGVECLRRDLYLPWVVMLGKVAEGSMREMLAEAALHLPSARSESLLTFLNNVHTGFSQIIRRSQDILTSSELAPAVDKARLSTVWPWAEVLRNARNTVHIGGSSAVRIDFGAAAMLFVAAPEQVGSVYEIRDRMRALHESCHLAVRR